MDPTIVWLTALLASFAEFAGVLALIAVIVAALKKFGVVNDVSAGQVLKGLGLLAFAVFVVVQGIFGITIPPAVDQIAGLLAQLLAALLGITTLIDRFAGTQLTARAVSLLKR